MHFQLEHFWPPLTVRDADVLATFDQLMRHMPAMVDGDRNLLYVCLQPINNPRMQIWYSRNRVFVKVLSGIVKMIEKRSNVEGNFSNKSLYIYHQDELGTTQVPREVGMLETGHKSPSSYERYDLLSEVRIAATQDILSRPYDDARKLKAYPQVLEEKFTNFCQNVEAIGSENHGMFVVTRMVCQAILIIRKFVVGQWSSCNVVSSTGCMKKSAAGSFDKDACGKAEVTGSGGLCFGTYKLGDVLPFDENLLRELPVESARALGIPPRSAPTRGVSVFAMCNMQNCVVNVYVGKENAPFGEVGK